MIFGIGTDLVQVARIEKAIARWGTRFAGKILTAQELAEFAETLRPAQFLAKRFCAKEAAAKALGTGLRSGVNFRQIQVYHDANGAPRLSLTGQARQLAENKRIGNLHLSISDEREYAIAFVVMSD